MIVIIEGIDRIGKSTCSKHLKDAHGFSTMHFGRPEGDDSRQRAFYQKATFQRTFEWMRSLDNQPSRVVMDRGHLGEWVYGPMYRGDSGVDLGYLWESESELMNTYLVLLHHQDLDIIRKRDDGLGFDISKIEEEQKRFVEAFDRSNLRNKTILDVTSLTIGSMLKNLTDILGLSQPSYGAKVVQGRQSLTVLDEDSFNGA